MAKRSYEVDMCRGPLLGKILIFAFPLMLSGILQLLFNAADIVVVGRFASSQALAAVGSTGALINLIINVFIGLSVGANVLVARYYGAGEKEQVSQAVHTSVLLSLLCGVVLIAVGVLLARPLLELMGTPDDVIDMSATYMRIYFCGMPVVMLYNFGAAILRSVGDTKRPLYFLIVAGLINVVLNLFFVIVCGMDVDGVALATVISQVVSAGLILLCLMRMEGPCHLDLHKLHIYKDKMWQIVRVGLPAGLQGCIFSISNVLIQSSVNSFGSVAMAGNTAASNIEGFVYNGMNAIYQTALSFTSQNYGARQYHRISRVMRLCLALVTAVGLGLEPHRRAVPQPASGHLFQRSSGDRLWHHADALCSHPLFPLRHHGCDGRRHAGHGLFHSAHDRLLTGACGLRILWIFTLFAANRTLSMLYVSYPVSWFITALAHLGCYFWVRRKMPREDAPLPEPEPVASIH